MEEHLIVYQEVAGSSPVMVAYMMYIITNIEIKECPLDRKGLEMVHWKLNSNQLFNMTEAELDSTKYFGHTERITPTMFYVTGTPLAMVGSLTPCSVTKHPYDKRVSDTNGYALGVSKQAAGALDLLAQNAMVEEVEAKLEHIRNENLVYKEDLKLLDRMRKANLWTRIKWVFTGFKVAH